MPPDMTAGLISPAGPPPGVTVSGKPATGPPGTEKLDASLFAALLAQSGSPVLKASAPLETLLQPVLQAQDPLPVLTRLKPPRINPATDPKLVIDPKPVIDPKLAIDPKKLTPGSLKTMDTAPTLSLLPAEKAKDKASELPLHQAPADTPPASSQTPVQTPVAGSAQAALPAALPPVLIAAVPVLVPFRVPVAEPVTTSARSATTSTNVLLPVQSVPLLRAAIDTAPAAGLPLPRTFTLTTPVSVPQPAPGTAPAVLRAAPAALPAQASPTTLALPAALAAPLVSATPAGSPAQVGPAPSASLPTSAAPAAATPALLAQLAPIMPSATYSPPVALQTAVRDQTVPKEQTVSKDQALPPVTMKLSTASLSLVRAVSAAPETLGSAQTGSQNPLAAAPALPTAAPSPTDVLSVPASLAGIRRFVPPAPTGQNVTLTQSNSETVNGKSVETALKSPAGNADINTRVPSADIPALPVKPAAPLAAPEPVFSGSEKRDPVRTSAVSSETEAANGLLGTQTSSRVGEAASPQSKPLSAADRAEIVRQAADGIGAMPLPAKAGAAQQMSLQLHPKDWGQLQVSVTVVPGPEAGSAKTVTAHIVAETPQVKAALQSQTGALHQALRASGLHLEHLTVSVKPAETQTVKPASESASAGMSSGQGQANTGGQPGTTPNERQPQTGQVSDFASLAGGFQNGRQGPPPPAYAAAFGAPDPELDEIQTAALPLRPAVGRIDTRA